MVIATEIADTSHVHGVSTNFEQPHSYTTTQTKIREPPIRKKKRKTRGNKKSSQDKESIDNNKDRMVVASNDKVDSSTSITPQENYQQQPTSDNASPRRQALMRYKKGNTNMNNKLTEMKEHLRSKTSVDEEGSSGLPQLDMDEKVTLFRYKSCKIVLFSEAANNTFTETGTGTLLAYGEFEIFQLHNGDVTYISCGNSFIYPLLPKMNLIRIGFGQFIIPLVNPDRYWKISINTEEPNVVDILLSTFGRIVQYKDLYQSIQNNDEVTNKKSDSSTQNITSAPLSSEQLEKVQPLTTLAHFPVISESIPESPPSSPGSVNPRLHYLNDLPRVSKDYIAMKTVSQGMAHMELSAFTNSQKDHFSHGLHSNLKQAIGLDQELDASMDSLLDEYEETLTQAASRPASRRQSISGSVRPKDIRSLIYDDAYDGLDNIPSLSEYNRRKKGAISRRSSRSDLYTSESGWMEPTLGVNAADPNPINAVGTSARIPKTRSHYSINSFKSCDLNQIYQSINKRQFQNGRVTVREPQSVTRDDRYSIRSMPIARNRNQAVPLGLSSNPFGSATITRKPQENLEKVAPNEITLKSGDIYQLLSSKETKDIKQTRRASFASRIFGW